LGKAGSASTRVLRRVKDIDTAIRAEYTFPNPRRRGFPLVRNKKKPWQYLRTFAIH
jgi:hypothetical protein